MGNDRNHHNIKVTKHEITPLVHIISTKQQYRLVTDRLVTDRLVTDRLSDTQSSESTRTEGHSSDMVCTGNAQSEPPASQPTHLPSQPTHLPSLPLCPWPIYRWHLNHQTASKSGTHQYWQTSAFKSRFQKCEYFPELYRKCFCFNGRKSKQ